MYKNIRRISHCVNILRFLCLSAHLFTPSFARLTHTLRGHTSDVNTVISSSIHLASPLLASCASDKTIRLWSLIKQTSTTLTRHTYQVHCLAFSSIPNDKNDTTAKYMASVSTDGTCLLWDLTTTSVSSKRVWFDPWNGSQC